MSSLDIHTARKWSRKAATPSVQARKTGTAARTSRCCCRRNDCAENDCAETTMATSRREEKS